MASVILDRAQREVIQNPPFNVRRANIDRMAFQRGNFADVGYDEAMRRSSELVPFLRKHAAASEAERRMPEAVTAELHRTGLFRYLQPKVWGGMELDFVASVDIPEMLARGDCSTAWNVANLASHHRTLALFSERAQREVWSENPDALIAAAIAYPQGRARKADGGLVLSGTWNFCSAVKGAGWNTLACVVRDGEKSIDWCQCLLRSFEYEVIDDWHTLGMRGTGSCTVKVEELFVPTYRTQSMATALPGHDFPGVKLNPNPMFRVPTSALGGHALASYVVGNAQAALDTMIDWVKSRSTNYTAASMRHFQTVSCVLEAPERKSTQRASCCVTGHEEEPVEGKTRLRQGGIRRDGAIPGTAEGAPLGCPRDSCCRILRRTSAKIDQGNSSTSA
jgi:3-hydroxy-9,10-secoandrosta-1,3,5(10)-triene-9,17-dione monooxygenase